MLITWLEDADLELAQIVSDVARHNRVAAVEIDLRVHAAVAHLGMFPEAGRAGRLAGTRELMVIDYPYFVLYRLIRQEVQILGVRHTSREWPV